MPKKIVFLTGTRADYGKMKSLMYQIKHNPQYELQIFVTGMHMLSKYGATYKEIEKDGFQDTFKFVNQQENSSMDITLSNTILGFSNYVKEYQPDLIVVHGDRLEALAGAIVGAFNNIRVAHIEGGEVSGTIDESIRHAVTKLAHLHFVANEEAKRRIIQLGEKEESIYIIGSPDIDIMFSDDLPNMTEAKEKYDIEFDEYGILMYHPVTTQVEYLEEHIKQVIDAIIESEKNYIVVYPNNDKGTDLILRELKRLKGERYRIFPSIKFEYFLTILKNAQFMIGNSSAGIRETSVYGIPAIDIGLRQKGRYDSLVQSNIIWVPEEKEAILEAIKKTAFMHNETISHYGAGNSAEIFNRIISGEEVWNIECQKYFIDMDSLKRA
ncbi:MAG: UDP-N-acetylglucosamine 2-epimerase (hydrolyzing) [Cellulosilyticum sp.]|nr:UDP-N-acetylglucosamine 2-epimerase (hydrolyzing) [Cellulosilyticum sp.]